MAKPYRPALLKRPHYKTQYGLAVCGDSKKILRHVKDKSVDLILTSPPYGLLTEKEYGNVASGEYVDWFMDFATEFYRVLKDSGSLVIEIGGTWNEGSPTRSLYHFELLLRLCHEMNFYLAQDFYWHNPAKLPTPAQWVTVNRKRVKDSVTPIWWLSKSEDPKADTRKVLYTFALFDLTI